MSYYEKPHFIIKKNLQKSVNTGEYFSDVITKEVMSDVCRRICGEAEYTYFFADNDYEDEWIERSYNKGRMALMFYQDSVSYISFSEKEIRGRNSCVQSVPTAYNMYYMSTHPKKRLFYYFLNLDGNPETDYIFMMYRLMETIGFTFLNPEAISQRITAFNSVEDIMFTRRINSGKNSSNNSTYITKSSAQQIDIYGKTYGANKYATSMMCYAMALLAPKKQNLTLYEVLEGDLKELPKSCLDVIAKMGKINVVKTDMQLEKKVFEENNSLRSPRYLFNLLDRLGTKKCALCECEIPELIQGAHIWPVSDIKKQALPMEQKILYATDGHNGLWLCENHHKMFDENLIKISPKGRISFHSDKNRDLFFMKRITVNDQLSDDYLSDEFLEYLEKRNNAIV